MALLGCDVVMTDQIEVLPLLRRNVERNTSRITQFNPGLFVLLNICSKWIEKFNEQEMIYVWM